MARDTHADITLDDGTSAYGLMLQKDAGGVKQYWMSFPEALSPQYFAGEAEYANMAPSRRLVIAQDKFHGGMGEWISETGVKCAKTIVMDTRLKRSVLVGPLSVEATVPTIQAPPTIPNAGMELDASWLNGAGTTARSSTQKHGGTYSWRVGGTDGLNWAYQDLTWDAAYQGKAFKVSCWVYLASANGGQARIGINDGITTTTYSSYTTTAAFVEIHVVKTLSASATQLRLILEIDDGYGTGNPNYAYFDDIAFTTPVAGSYSVFYEAGDGTLYLGWNNVLLKWNESTPAFEVADILDYAITDIAEWTDGTVFVACGGSYNLWYGAAAPLTESNTKAQHIFLIANQFWKSILNNNMYSCTTTPQTNANWSTAYKVGSGATDITGLEVLDDKIIVLKEDGSYYLDSNGTVHNLTSELRYLLASTTGKNAISWQEKLYIPCSAQGLLEYDGGTLTDISPAKYAPKFSDYAGRVAALAADAHYLYACLISGAGCEILAGRWEEIDGVTDWRWHSISLMTTYTPVHALVATAQTTRRFWMCSSVSTQAPLWIYLPAQYNDPLSDSTYRFYAGTAFFYTPYYETSFKEADKAWFSLTLLTSGVSATRTITVSFQTSELALTGAWTTLGIFNANNQTKYFKAAVAAGVTGKKIRFRLTCVNTPTTSSIEIFGLVLKGVVEFTSKEEWRLVIKGENNVVLKDGKTKSKHLRKNIISQLKTWKNTSWPVTLYPYDYDDTSTSYDVKITEMEEMNLQSISIPGDPNKVRWASDILLTLSRCETA